MIRIVTWNLERPRPRQTTKIDLLRAQLADVAADIWVLTETHSTIWLGDEFSCVSTPQTAHHAVGECWTSIWSRWPIKCQIPTSSPLLAICAEIESRLGPMIIYGTVLPYHADRGASGTARQWEEHYRETAVQGADWLRLRQEYPNHRFCLAGDLNQSRDGRRWGKNEWYGTRRGRADLTVALREAGIICVTDGDLVGSGELSTRSTIDHICLDESTAKQLVRVFAWSNEVNGVRVSDHNGIGIELTATKASDQAS